MLSALLNHVQHMGNLREYIGTRHSPVNVSGLKITYERSWSCWPAKPISAVMSRFWQFKILKILFLNNFPIKPKKLPHIHKKVLLKSINVLIALKVSLKCVCDLHFHRQWARTAFYSTGTCRVTSDNNQNSILFYKKCLFNCSYSVHSFILIYDLHWMQFWLCKHFQFLKTNFFSVFEKNWKICILFCNYKLLRYFMI